MGNNEIDLANDAFFDGANARSAGVEQINPYPDGTSENRFWGLGWHAADKAGLKHPLVTPPSFHLNPALMMGTAYIPKEKRFETEEDHWCNLCDHAVHDCRCDG